MTHPYGSTKHLPHLNAQNDDSASTCNNTAPYLNTFKNNNKINNFINNNGTLDSRQRHFGMFRANLCDKSRVPSNVSKS